MDINESLHHWATVLDINENWTVLDINESDFGSGYK